LDLRSHLTSSVRARSDELAAPTGAQAATVEDVLGAAVRDRFIDGVRVMSVAMIIIGHWSVARVWRVDGRLGVTSAVDGIVVLEAASWIFMTVPLLFFVGGFSNAVTLRSTATPGTLSAFYGGRFSRLLRPTGVFLGVWLLIQAALHLSGVGGNGLVRGVSPAGTLPFGPLWFLAVYAAAVGCTPVAWRLHQRHGWLIPILMTVATLAVDAIRFVAGVELVGWANLPMTWLLAHQLGFFYVDGRLESLRRRVVWAMMLAGLLLLIAASFFGPYPISIGGTHAHRISNMNPPTIVITGLVWWQVALIMLVRPAARRWLAGPRFWRGVSRLNSIVMTAYLWHMTAYLLGVLTLEMSGLDEPANVVSWWLQRPLWILAATGCLFPLLGAFGRIERRWEPRAALAR
jgi:hypothetical protein